MTDEAVSPLRRRMIEDMTIRKFAPTDNSNEPHQERHLVTASRSCKSVRRARCLSTGHGRARPDSRHPPQIVRQFIEIHAIRHVFVSRVTVAQLVATAPSKSASSPAALKSP